MEQTEIQAVQTFTPGGEIVQKFRKSNTAMLVALSLAGFGHVSHILAGDQLEWLFQGKPLEHWVEEAKAPEPDRRQQAVQAVNALLNDQPQRRQDFLIEMLSDENASVRLEALRRVFWGTSPTEENEKIIKAVSARLIDPQESPNIRDEAGDALGELGLAGAQALAEASKKIQEARVRAQAIESLGRVPSDLYEEVAGMAPVREALNEWDKDKPRRPRTSDELKARLRAAVERVEDESVRDYALERLQEAEKISDLVVERMVQEVNAQDVPPEAKMGAMLRLLSSANHPKAKNAIESLTQMLDSGNEQLRFWAACNLAAIAPKSKAGDRAVEILAAHFLAEIVKPGSEMLMWSLRFATKATSRRDEIYEKILAKVDGKTAVGVQKVRLGLLEDLNALTPEFLISLLDVEDMYLRKDVVEELGALGPSAAKKAAPALAKVLEEPLKNPDKQRQLFKAIVEALAKIDPHGKHTPLDSETLIRLPYLGIYHQWVADRFRDGGPARLDDLVQAIEEAPKQPLDHELERNLASRNPASRLMQTLVRVGKPAVPRLKQMVIEGTVSAASGLSQIRPEGINVLIELSKHQDSEVREHAVGALFPIESLEKEVFETLMKAARDEDVDVRRSALRQISRFLYVVKQDQENQRKLNFPEEQLERLVPILSEALLDREFQKRKRPKRDADRGPGAASIAVRVNPFSTIIDTARSLAAFKPEAAVEIYREALRKTDPKNVREILRALRSLGEQSAPALPEVRGLMQVEQLQVEALETIAAMGPKAAEEAEDLLRKELKSENRHHRFWAAVALGQIEEGVEAALPVLIHVLETGGRTDDRSEDLRVLAAQALGRMGPAAEPAIEPLLELARLQPEIPKPQIRNRAQDLEKIPERLRPREGGTKPGEDPGEVYDVIQAAVIALGQIGRQPEKVVPILTERLVPPKKNDRFRRSTQVAGAAAKALQAFGPKAEPAAEELIPYLNEHHETSAEKTLRAMGEPAIPALAAALEEDYQIAIPAAKLLGKMGTKSEPAVPALLDVVRDLGAHWNKRTAAISALGQIGPAAKPAVPYLEVLAKTKPAPGWMEKNHAEAARAALKLIKE